MTDEKWMRSGEECVYIRYWQKWPTWLVRLKWPMSSWQKSPAAAAAWLKEWRLESSEKLAAFTRQLLHDSGMRYGHRYFYHQPWFSTSLLLTSLLHTFTINCCLSLQPFLMARYDQNMKTSPTPHSSPRKGTKLFSLLLGLRFFSNGPQCLI